MRALQRASLAAMITALLLCVSATARAQVNGNATISAPSPVFGQPLTLSTSTQFAGGVSSIKWGNKEFINNWDHGRQLSPNYQFFNRYICYNPYETGSIVDGNKSTSSSKLLSLTSTGNRLESTTQLAWYYDTFRFNPKPEEYCGDPSQWLPVTPYTSPLSNYKVHKTVTIGFAGIPNVIEYLTDVYIPEVVQKALAAPTAVLNFEFSNVRSWDVVSKDYRKIRSSSGEDDRIKVLSTADGNYAMGWYAPELLQPYGDPGAVNWWFVVPPNPNYPDPNNPSQPDPYYACVHFGTIHRYDSFSGPGWGPPDRVYLVVGNLDQVKDGLAQVHSQFTSLDPEIFNWREYLSLNNLGFLTTPEAAQNHWLTQGVGQGLRGSKAFSASQYLQLNPDIANAFGATNYAAAMGHFVNAGRAEGRTTVAKPAPGMQHLLVFENRGVNATGQNAFGQLGASTSPVPPTHIPNLDNAVTEIAAGDYTSFAVKNDGTLWMWGSNQYGARGDGSKGNNITAPVQVPIPVRVTTPSRAGKHAVAVGTGVYAAVDTQGQVWTWGINWNGRLGDGTTTPRFTPGRVRKTANPDDYLTGVVSIASGGGTMAAVDADGTVWTWGAGANGRLGNGFTDDSGYAVQVLQVANNNTTTPLVGVTQVACGSSGYCIALSRYGQVFGWGNNSFSQMGIAPGGALSIATPIVVGPGAIDMIAAGAGHCLAHSAADGKLYGWGYNGYGQLGAGFANVAQYPPVVMSAGPDGMGEIGDFAAYSNFSAMVRYTDRAVFGAGDNQSGQFGLGQKAPQYLPVRIH